MSHLSKYIRQELSEFLYSCRCEGELWMFPPLVYLLLLTTLLAMNPTKLNPTKTYLKLMLPVPFATLTVLQLKKAGGRGQKAEGTIEWGFRPQPIVSAV